MALRTFNPATGKWEVVATSQAVEVKVVDLEDNFESNNVEGCLRELKGIGNENLSKIEELLSDFADHVLNHPGGSGPGGPGGGGGTDIYVSVTTEMDTNIITSITSQVIINFEYDSSIKKDGTATITVNNILKNTRKVQIGPNSIDVTSFIEKGNNELVIEVANMYGVKESIIFNIDVVDLEITAPAFNYSGAFSDSISFPYSVKGSVSKVIHFFMDGNEIHTETIKSTNTIQKIYTMPKQTHGVHKLKVYATSSLGNEILTSNVLEYEIICTESGNNKVLISSQFNIAEIDQYSMLSIPFIVFDPSALKANVELKINNKVVSTLSVGREEQRWNLTNYPAGKTTFTIQCGEVKRDFIVNVKEVIIDVTEETNGLELYLSSNGRSNSEDNKDVWKFGDIQAEFKNFNWVSDGWLADENGFTALTVGGDASVVIPFKPFEKDCRLLGKTIEIEFAVLDSIDYDTTVISCVDINNRGFQISCKDAMIKSNETSTKTLFKDGERLRVSFCIEPSSSNRIIYTYIDGIVSGLTQYSVSDMFTQLQPANITIGSKKCITRIYNIRIYDNCLSTTSILNNYIYDKDDINSKIESYNKNNIYDSYGQIVYSRILNQIPCMIITGTLPETKGDIKTVSVKFENKEDSSKNIADPSVTIDLQGTSSQFFPRKNYLLTFNNPYQLRDTSIAVNTFCIKADFMESSHSHNTGLAKVIDGLYREKVPPQVTNSRIRTTVDGYPIAVFYKETNESALKYYGVYNFNNDKSTHQVFGYGDNSECWELCNNTSERVLFNESDYSSDDWQKDFQSRYPAKNTNYTNLKRLTDWLVEVKKNPARFKEEFNEYFNEHYTLMYYLLTELFGMVDSRAKNMFLASWDKKIWYPVFYDMDTVLGINNEGVLGFGYNIEYHDIMGELHVFNGEKSSLWNNVEISFPDKIADLYNNLRNNGILTYEKVLNILLGEQISKICEAQYNEDAKYKYLDPLTEDKDSTYLYTAQGSRENHLKYWLYNRINYMDSKYLSSAYKDNYITLRLYTPSVYNGVTPNPNFTLTPYADQYVRVKYGSYEVYKRSTADEKTLIVAPSNIEFNDTETIIYGANRLSSVGDLSDKYAGTIDVSKATQLGELIIGSDKTGYTNGNLTELSLGNNRLLRKLDITNCINLKKSLNVSGCTSIEEIHAKGTSIPSLMLPSSGNLKILHLPGSIANLTIVNKPKLQIITFESYDKINILRLENVGINAMSIFNDCPNVENVRLMNLNDNIGYTTINRLMETKGMDENGSTIPISQAVSGNIHIKTVSEHLLEIYKAAFPYVTFTVGEFSKSYEVIFKDGDDNIIYVDTVIENGEAIYRGETPTKTSTAQYDYTWEGWDRALQPILGPTVIKATFHGRVRSHIIRFINPDTGVVISEQNVPYGEMPKIPEFPGKYNYWGSIVEPVSGPVDYTAMYVPLPEDYTIFNFENNSDGTLSCTLRSVPNLPTLVIVPFMYENKYVTALRGENNTTGKDAITEFYIPNTIKKWGGYIYTGCENLLFENAAFPKTLPENANTDALCYKWGGLTHANFPSGVKTIGSYCFKECKNLVSVNIPEGVTTLKRECFHSCPKLKKVDLPESVHELTEAMLFENSPGILCFNGPGVTKLTSYDIFYGNGGKIVVSLGSTRFPVTVCSGTLIHHGKALFLTTQNGEKSDIVEGDVNSGKIFCYPFDVNVDCGEKEVYAELKDEDDDKAILCAITDRSIPTYDLTNIANTGRHAHGPILSNCFTECRELKSIDIPEGVTELGDYCFRHCTKLTSVTLSDTVTSLGGHCFQYSALTSIDCNKVTSVGGHFLSDISSLKYINMPCVSILHETRIDWSHGVRFVSMGSKEHPVTFINMANNNLGECCIVTTTRGIAEDIVFESSTSLDRFYFTTMDSKWVKTNDEIYAELNDGDVQDKAIMGECLNKVIQSYDLTNINNSNRKAYGVIAKNCFKQCGELKSIDIPEGVTKLAHGCFHACGKLSTVNISNTVTELGPSCFHDCSKITSIILPESVTTLGDSCFSWCSSLQIVDAPGVTKIGTECFYWIWGLMIMNLPKLTKFTDNAMQGGCKFISMGSKEHPVTYIGGNNRFDSRCFIVTTSDGERNRVEINTESKYYFTAMDSKWVKTSDEIYAELNDGDVQDKAIMGECLNKVIQSYDLTNINNSNRKAYDIIVSNCFSGCNALANIIMSDTVKIIENSCFFNCKKITSIILPESVTTLGDSCFNGCEKLETIDAPGVTDVGTDCFHFIWNVKYMNFPKLSKIKKNAFYGTCKFISLGSKEHPVTHIGQNNSYISNSTHCIITTKTGSKNDVVSETDLSKCFFTTMDSKWVKTEKEIYAELDDDKAVLGELCDKTVETYDLNNINGTRRKAHGKIVGNCFKNCVNLNNVSIPEGVTELGDYCFAACNSMTNFSLSNTVEIIGEWCFNGLPMREFDCKNVSTIKMRAFWDSRIEIINMPRVTNLPAGVINSGVHFFSIGSEGYPVTSFGGGNHVSKWCIITTEDGNALEGFTGNPYYFTNKGYKWVRTKEEVYAVAYNDNTKAIMGECLNKGIKSYDLANIANRGVSAYEAILKNCFKGCNDLAEVNIPEGVINIGDSCFTGTKLINVTLPDGVKSIGSNCFYNCGMLQEVVMTDSVTKLGDGCFDWCRQLVRVDLSNNITELPYKCFADCVYLRDITMPDNVEVIGTNCFWGTALTEINVGNKIRLIKYRGFGNINNARSVRILGSVSLEGEVFGQKSFGDNVTLGSPEHPVQSFDVNTFRNLTNTRLTIYTSSGDDSSLTGSPWGAGSGVEFAYVQA